MTAFARGRLVMKSNAEGICTHNLWQIVAWNGHLCGVSDDESSALAVIEACWLLRRQCAGLLTVALSSGPASASCLSELTLSTHRRLSRRRNANDSYDRDCVEKVVF